jgi:predicted metalloprotease
MYAPEITGPWAEFPNPYSAGLIRLSATHTLAHEYGHHVQQLSGIFAAIARRYSGSREERAELQASCLGNVFLSSQRAAYPILEDYGQRPESWRYIQVPNHGSVANQQVWTDRGYLGARPGDCNTFKASRAATS